MLYPENAKSKLNIMLLSDIERRSLVEIFTKIPQKVSFLILITLLFASMLLFSKFLRLGTLVYLIQNYSNEV